jgi:hypothetical protein
MLRCSLADLGGLRLLGDLDKTDARGTLDLVQRKEGVPANSAKLLFWRASEGREASRKFGKINVFCRIRYHRLWSTGVRLHKM